MRSLPAPPGGPAYGGGAASGGPPAPPGSQSPAAGNPCGEKEEHKGPLPIKALPLGGSSLERQTYSARCPHLLQPVTQKSLTIGSKETPGPPAGRSVVREQGSVSAEAGKAEAWGRRRVDRTGLNW